MTPTLTRRTALAGTLASAAATVLPAAAAADPVPVYVPTGRPPRQRFWAEGAVLNQGQLDACEAFAQIGSYLAATGVEATSRDGNRLGRYVLRRANQLENEAGYLSDESIGSESGMRVAAELGLVESWSYPQTVEDLVDAVVFRGPVVVGLRLTDSIANTRGREIPEAGGVRAGRWQGHAVVATAYLPEDRRAGRGPSLRLRNSWGASWGDGGSAWMTVEHLRANLGPMPHIGEYQTHLLPLWLPAPRGNRRVVS